MDHGVARNEAEDNEMADQRGPMNHQQEFGCFPKGSRKALSYFEPGEVNTDTHFGELAFAGRCSIDWSWTTLEA